MTIEDEIRRATKLMEAILQARGSSRKDVDQKIGAGAGYFSQVLTGRMELKLRHILALLRALEIEPSLFFGTLYPEGRPATDDATMGEFLKRFSRLGAVSEPSPPALAPVVDADELERLIQSAVRTALAERAHAAAKAKADAELIVMR